MIISRPWAFGAMTGIVALASYFAMDNSEMMAGGRVYDAATVLAIFVMNMLTLLVLLVWPRQQLRRLALLMLVGNGSAVWLRLAFGLNELDFTQLGASVVPPQQGWVPILFLAAFAFLPRLQAIRFSVLFWLACVGLLLSQALPHWEAWQSDLMLRTLLRQHLLAHPVYMMLLLLIPGAPSSSGEGSSRDCSDQSSA